MPPSEIDYVFWSRIASAMDSRASGTELKIPSLTENLKIETGQAEIFFLFTLNTTALPVLPKMDAKKQQIFFKTYCFMCCRWAAVYSILGLAGAAALLAVAPCLLTSKDSRGCQRRAQPVYLDRWLARLNFLFPINRKWSFIARYQLVLKPRFVRISDRIS